MGVSGSPNRISSGQLVGADNQKTQNNSDLDNSNLEVYFFLAEIGHVNSNIGLTRCFAQTGIHYPAISLTVSLITEVISRSSMAALPPNLHSN